MFFLKGGIILKPIVIDLFCGAGGMSEGLLQAGFHIVFSSDINKQVARTYQNRHEQLGIKQGVHTHFEQADVRDLHGTFILEKIRNLSCFENKNIKEIDAIFGGPPCQGFSRAGKRMKNDPRNMLFKEYVRIIDEVHPKYVVMENVEGFMDTKLENFEGHSKTIYEGDTLVSDLLQKELNLLGYSVLTPQVLDASEYGVPQRRKRVIFIAYRNDQRKPSYPKPITKETEKKVSVLEAISDLIVDESIKHTYYFPSSYQSDSHLGRTKKEEEEESEIHNHEFSKHDLHIKERFSLYREGETPKRVYKRLLEEGMEIERYPNLLQYCVTKLNGIYSPKEIIKRCKKGNIDEELLNIILTKKNSRTRLKSDDVAPTMLSNGDDFLSPFENRALSVREMARIQSFDDSFEFLGPRTTGGLRRRIEVPQYTQVGNAVPPLLAKAVASEIKKVL